LRTRAANAIFVPSGDHAGSLGSSFSEVIFRASPPASGRTYSWAVFSSPRDDVNARRLPSGDQRGDESRFAPDVSWRGAVDPSTDTSQIALR